MIQDDTALHRGRSRTQFKRNPSDAPAHLMAPDYNLMADTCPAPFKSAAKDSPSIGAHVRGIRQDTRLGWDHRVRRASAQRQDGGVGSREYGQVVVDGGDLAFKARWRELVRRQHGDDGRDVWGG